MEGGRQGTLVVRRSGPELERGRRNGRAYVVGGTIQSFAFQVTIWPRASIARGPAADKAPPPRPAALVSPTRALARSFVLHACALSPDALCPESAHVRRTRGNNARPVPAAPATASWVLRSVSGRAARTFDPSLLCLTRSRSRLGWSCAPVICPANNVLVARRSVHPPWKPLPLSEWRRARGRSSSWVNGTPAKHPNLSVALLAPAFLATLVVPVGIHRLIAMIRAVTVASSSKPRSFSLVRTPIRLSSCISLSPEWRRSPSGPT